MKKTLLAVALATAFIPYHACAEQGDWVIRVRTVEVSPNEHSRLGKTVNQLGLGNIMSPGAELKLDDTVIPKLDISYYFTKHIASELILALGTRHNVKIHGDSAGVIGNQKLGSVNLLPPTMTLQWHFNPDQMFDPYVGIGANYSRMLDRNLRFKSGATASDKIKIDRDSFGLALQAGMDINLESGWIINADVKYIRMDTDVKWKGPLSGNQWTKIDTLDINPWVFGIGIGKRF